ncbi:dual specificity protein phosphatase 12-like [Pomacea canaliculata]|uniref:dual specificity protein phosphatase 12-like n=1 Tax=Pomacea canaliculata TaxID=400727 RepID=UPI000D730702|nr:dual specificity protein phosphatase 12-like [Pomacea canaliculata]
MDVNCDAVLDNLYLGGIQGPFNSEILRSQGITHILSILDRPLLAELVEGFKYKFIYALDLYDTDLLQDMEECLEFIEQGRQEGSVLVHCQAGASRSATIVIAYLMRACHMARDEALSFVKKQRPIVNPNQGFLEQLQLFENMGCRVDRSHEEFRMYTLNKLAIRIKSGVHKEAIPANIYVSETASKSSEDIVYKCRKCRRPLFRQSVVLSHKKGEGESAFDWRSKIPPKASEMKPENLEAELEAKCDISLFVEPIEWMKGKIEHMEGKLSCPKCSAKLGSFVWYGERCPCGAWVAPAFHIQRNKVDEVKPHAVAPIPQQRTSLPPSYQLPVVVDPENDVDGASVDVNSLPLA